MSSRMLTCRVVVICCLSFLCVSVVRAQTAQRTFVSTSGNDANASSMCPNTAPCRTFNTAISVTTAGGEILAVTSGGYGPVTVDKAIQLIAPLGVYAGVTALSGDAITVNALAADSVVVRGLSLNGIGGVNGLTFNTGAALHVENVVVNGFSLTGIEFKAAAKLFVNDTTIRKSHVAIDVFTVALTSAVTIDHCRLENNSAGVNVTVNIAQVTVRDSVIAGNSSHGILVSAGFTSVVDLMIENSALTNNVASGLHLQGAGETHAMVTNSTFAYNGIGIEIAVASGSTTRVAHTTITRNTTGILRNNGQVISFINNRLVDNGTNGVFSSTFVEN